MRKLLTLLLSLVIVSLITACETLTPAQELQMGREEHGKIEKQSGGLYPDPQIQQYVQTVGQRLAHFAGRPDMDWQYRVVNSDEINAFAVPGGYIYINYGLLKRLHSEAQLAGILGHETSHIAHRDTVQQIERTQGANVLSTAAGVAGSLAGFGAAGNIAGVATQLALLSYDRDQEKQADLTGLQYMVQAGYDPAGMLQAMQIIKSASTGGRAPAFLSTHPDPGDRLQYLKKAVDANYSAAGKTGKDGVEDFQANVLSHAH